MFHGKMKAVTFSYDDGITQDQRLIAMLNHYGLKGTFNLNSGLMGHFSALIREDVTVAHARPLPRETERIYRGHEVAAHTLTHPLLPELPDEEIIREVEQDRLALSDMVGYEVKGMAYPGGGVNFDERVAGILREHTGVRYARTTVSSHSFDMQSDLYCFRPTVYHHREWTKMEELVNRFLAEPADKPQLLYIWGHAYEFDIRNDWDAFDKLLARLAGHPDVFYGTNSEVLLGEESAQHAAR